MFLKIGQTSGLLSSRYLLFLMGTVPQEYLLHRRTIQFFIVFPNLFPSSNDSYNDYYLVLKVTRLNCSLRSYKYCWSYFLYYFNQGHLISVYQMLPSFSRQIHNVDRVSCLKDLLFLRRGGSYLYRGTSCPWILDFSG